MMIMRSTHRGFLRHFDKFSSSFQLAAKLLTALLHFLFYFAFQSNLEIIIAQSLLTTGNRNISSNNYN